jgi:hypothetical protein
MSNYALERSVKGLRERAAGALAHDPINVQRCVRLLPARLLTR